MRGIEIKDPVEQEDEFDDPADVPCDQGGTNHAWRLDRAICSRCGITRQEYVEGRLK